MCWRARFGDEKANLCYEVVVLQSPNLVQGNYGLVVGLGSVVGKIFVTQRGEREREKERGTKRWHDDALLAGGILLAVMKLPSRPTNSLEALSQKRTTFAQKNRRQMSPLGFLITQRTETETHCNFTESSSSFSSSLAFFRR